MTRPLPGADERSDRILAEKLRLLYRANFAIAANFLVGAVVAFCLRDAYPAPVIAAWLVATALVTVLRLALHSRHARAAKSGRCTLCWAKAFTAGTFASGLLWGALCAGLPFWGDTYDYVLLTMVAAGMTAGALTTIMAYLPAYLAYAVPFCLPLAMASLMHKDADITADGVLILLYLVVIAFAARNLARSVNRTIELQVDNETLQDSLKQTQIERDAARTDKWSTLAQLSHELRTPLNAIMGFSEAMREEFFGPLGNARYKDYAGHVHASGKHLLTLTDEILELSQGESGKLELNESDVDLAAVARNCLGVMAPAAEKAELTLKDLVPAGLALLRADEAKIRQMLFQLVDNAIKFTPPQGEVLLKASPAPGGGIDLVVQDTGIGIKAEDIPLAMQPFGRIASPLKHEKEGTGLGLPICKRLAELHGAQLTIDSQPGKGTACRISFPASRSVAEAA
jgi:signal transduction histidine kinase